MKARTLLLMCGLSLAGTAAADPIGAPRHGPNSWLFGPPPEGYDLLRKGPQAAAPQLRQRADIIPLPRPRPHVPEMSEATQIDALEPSTPVPSPAPLPQLTPVTAAVARASSAIQIRADGDPISKVLTDIAKVVDLQYRTSIPLDAMVSATYSGPADTVITHLLSDNGYSFAISHRGEMVVVSIYGRWLEGASTANFPSNPIPPPAPTPAPTPAPAQPPSAAEEQRLAAGQERQQHPPSPPREPRVPWGIEHRPH